MQVGVGLRVIRGPDWEGGNEDGGEGYVGYVGTVVAGARADGGAEEGRHDVATVQWDVGGERHVYRCGAEGKYDLRVIDSAPAGVVHRHMECSGCGSESIAGCVWRCVHCLRYYLCTLCYMKDRHSVWHHFMRIDSPEKPGQRTRVRCRYLSGRVAARGVFVGARVVRGGDWRWSDQDGGAGREGTVVEIGGWQSESSRSVAVVEWRESGVKNKYRLGHKGKVDLQCRVAAEGGHCYLEHLPLLGSDYVSSTPFICAGDLVQIDMDNNFLKQTQDSHKIADLLGTTLLASYVNPDMKTASVFHRLKGYGVPVPVAALKMVEGPDIAIDDVVRVIDDMAEVHRLQKEGHGWDDDMALSLGQLGRVVMIDDSGGVVVRVNGRRWLLNSNCVLPAPGQQPEDEMMEMEPPLGTELLWMSMMKDSASSVLDTVVTRGYATMLAGMLKKEPELVNVNAPQNNSTLLHLAAAEGRLNCVQVLLEHKANIRARDLNGETPLHRAVHYNHYEVAKVLLEKGSDVNEGECKGLTVVHAAAHFGFFRILNLLLAQPNCLINAQCATGETALYYACRNHWPHITRQLLHSGADPSLVNESGHSPLIGAVMSGFYRGVEVHLETHPNIVNDARAEDGCGPLHIATFKDDYDIVSLLASVDVCDIDLLTLMTRLAPLHIATRDGHIRCVERLVGYGADIMITDLQGGTPLHYVLGNKNMEPLSEWTPHLNEFHEYVSGADNSIQSVPVYITVACFLVSEGATNLETSVMSGLTPLHLCSPEYHSLLKLFARPERKGSFRGSLPRHPPPVPRSIPTQGAENAEASSSGTFETEALLASDSNKKKEEMDLVKPGAKPTPTKSVATPTKSVATPTKSEATPTRSEATPPEVSVSGGDSNKTEESEVDSVTGPSCFLCEGPCDITFQPCGHTAMCAECCESTKKCPLCKTAIENKIKITV